MPEVLDSKGIRIPVRVTLPEWVPLPEFQNTSTFSTRYRDAILKKVIV